MNKIKCHPPIDPIFTISSIQPGWDENDRCNYCGSYSPEHFLKYLTETENPICYPADQKYGYLHKIYYDDHKKFYTQHLFDMDDPQPLLEILEKRGGIKLKLK